MKKIIISSLSAFALVSCASITDSKMQPISVNALYKGNNIEGAQCALVNNKGTWYVNSPGSVVIQKSYGDLAVTCKKNKVPTGILTTNSSSNKGVWGNILLGGPIGYAIDSSSGAGFDYPSTINVMMGRNIDLKPPTPQQLNKDKKQGDFDNLNQ